MKRLFITVLATIFFTSSYCLADDLWDNYGDQHVYGQQAVSDKEFEQAIEQKKRTPFGFRKKRDKNIPKGDEQHQSNETQFIKEAEEEMPILPVTVNLVGKDGKILPVGHYQVDGVKVDGKPVLKLYQAHFLIGEIPATITEDDFNQETVHFVKILEHNEKQVKIIFGSIDFNAYSIINIAE